MNPERYRNLLLEDVFRGQRIGDIGSVPTKKINPSKTEPGTEFGLIRIDDWVANPVAIRHTRVCRGSQTEGSYFEVAPGDLLFARLGPTIQNRKTLIVPAGLHPSTM